MTNIVRDGIRILAVGTELTDGQVLEKNAAWLASRLTEMGYRVLEHRTISDDRATIESVLHEFLSNSDGIVVTGGLGPTSDDFTRECVAASLSRELKWHAPSWAKIEHRLLQRGAPVTENQKSQAFFPEGAEVLLNSAGTADGFFITDLSKSRFLAVLPGPPAEIAAIWASGLAERLRVMAPNRKERKLLLFKTMGRGEGFLATQTEKILDSLEHQSGLPRIDVGYRANVPFVELKFWLDHRNFQLEEALRSKITSEFADILVAEGDFDFADRILALMRSGRKAVVCDSVTDGLLLDRLRNRFAQHPSGQAGPISLFTQMKYFCGVEPSAEPGVLVMGVQWAHDPQSDIRLTLIFDGIEKQCELKLPVLATSNNRKEDLNERGRRWVVELALKYWSENV